MQATRILYRRSPHLLRPPRALASSQPVQIHQPNWKATLQFEIHGEGGAVHAGGAGLVRTAHPSDSCYCFGKNWTFVVYKELNRIIYWSYTNFKEAVDHKTLFIDDEAMPASKGPIAVSTTGTAPAEGIRVYVQAENNKLLEYCLDKEGDKGYKGDLMTQNNYKAIEGTTLSAVGNPITLLFNATDLDHFNIATMTTGVWATQNVNFEVPKLQK